PRRAKPHGHAVRFGPKADMRTPASLCPLRAKSRHSHCSKDHRYSITSSARSRRAPFAYMGLPLWPRKAQLKLCTKYVAVEACNPPTPSRGNIEVIDRGLDVRRDVVPIKLRIFIDDVRRRLVAELPVQTNLFKFVVKRIGFSQIVRIAKLTDEICGSQE